MIKSYKTFIIIGITGMPCAKKTSIAKIMSSYGIPYFTLSSILDKELTVRGIDTTPINYARLASELRKNFGEDVLARRIWRSIKVNDVKIDTIIIDGIRSPAEALFFHTVGKCFFLVLVHSSPEARFRRFKQNKHPFINTLEQFEAQDKTNLELGMGEIIAKADYVIINESYYEKSIKNQVRNLYQFLKRKITSHNITQKTLKE